MTYGDAFDVYYKKMIQSFEFNHLKDRNLREKVRQGRIIMGTFDTDLSYEGQVTRCLMISNLLQKGRLGVAPKPANYDQLIEIARELDDQKKYGSIKREYDDNVRRIDLSHGLTRPVSNSQWREYLNAKASVFLDSLNALLD